MSTKYHYIRAGDGFFGDGYDVECDFLPSSWRYVARACANDYFHNHDGWESNWPLEFEIFTADGKSIGIFEVAIDYDPYFSPTKKLETTPPQAKPE